MKLLLILSGLVFGALAERVRYDNYQLHRVYPTKQQHVDALTKLSDDKGFIFWIDPTRVDKPSDVMVPPNKTQKFSEFVRREKMRSELVIENVQKLIDEEQAAINARNRSLEWTNYHSLEEFETWMDDLSKKYDHVKVIVAGKTYEKRDIKGIEITFGVNQRTVFIESNTHSREWISAAATSWVVNEILKSPADSIWRKFNYIYIPFYNPDGYVYSWTTNRMWKKTRTPYKNGTTICYGADPGVNWDFHWNEFGSSSDPCTDGYQGPRPFSEVETRTLSEFLKKNAVAKKIDAYLAFHSYSQLIMYPWGWSAKPAPHSRLWHKIAQLAAAEIQAMSNKTFTVGDINHLYAPSSGGSMEWFYANYNSTISFYFELQDEGRYGFLLPRQFILPSAKELYVSLRRVLEEYAKLPSKY